LATLGQEADVYMATTHNVGNALMTAGQYSEALPYYEECCASNAKLLGTTHPRYLQNLLSTGNCQMKL